MRFYIVFVFLYIFTISCESDKQLIYQDKNALIFKDSLTLVEGAEVKFPLDSTDFLDFGVFQIFEEDNTTYLSMFNPFNLKLNIYNYDDRARKKTIYFESEGPNSVGKSTNNIGLIAIGLNKWLVHNYAAKQ